MRRVVDTIFAGMLGVSLVANDVAGAATCYTLQAELAHLQGEGGGGAGSRARYERAFREQANVLARTERRARNAGCFGRGFLFFRRRPDTACETLLPKLRDMQDNLAKLDRQRRRGGSAASNARRIRQLQSAIATRGCGMAGRDSFEAPERIDDWSRGTYRTLCVRTCDGYYFPVSYATTPRQFGLDAQTCAAMCPGTEAKLYAHRNPGSGPEDMVGIDGGRYVDLATAFQYRTALDPACTCRSAGAGMTTASIDGRPPLDPAAAEDGTPPPMPRPGPGEDPETLANRAGGFVPQATDDAGAAIDPAVATASGDRQIRVVGPPHWGAKGKDSVVLTPVPNPANARRRVGDPDRS